MKQPELTGVSLINFLLNNPLKRKFNLLFNHVLKAKIVANIGLKILTRNPKQPLFSEAVSIDGLSLIGFTISIPYSSIVFSTLQYPIPSIFQ